MDKKILAAIILLVSGLLVGGFVLDLKNKGALLAAVANGAANQQWIEIKPRTDDGQNKDAASLVPKAKKTNSGSGGVKLSTNQADSAAKKTAAPVEWCPVLPEKAKVSAVIINEAAWMGSDSSHTDEWIELKNLFRDPVDLGGWQLQNKSKGIKITFKDGSVVLPGGFYLLERTDDTTVPGVGADAIYTGNLANANEALYLFDASCQIQDSVAATPLWPAGDNTSKRTMERTADLLWRTSIKPGGTPKQENSVY